MERFIPFEKLSKKEQRKRNAQKRGTWYGLNPVTRKPQNSKAYHRQRARKWSDESISSPFEYAPLALAAPWANMNFVSITGKLPHIS